MTEWLAKLAREAAASQARFLRDNNAADTEFRQRQQRARDDDTPADESGDDDDATHPASVARSPDAGLRPSPSRFA